jgi:hypothetical protein
MAKGVTNGAAAPTIDEQAAERDELFADLVRWVEASISDLDDVRERIGLFAGGRDIETIRDSLRGTKVRMIRVRDMLEEAR